jgi:hypothetical protein
MPRRRRRRSSKGLMACGRVRRSRRSASWRCWRMFGPRGKAETTPLTFPAAEDGYVSLGRPTATHGSIAYLASSGSQAEQRPYVKFNVSCIAAGAVLTATLQLWALASSTATFTVRQVPTTWTDGSLSCRNDDEDALTGECPLHRHVDRLRQRNCSGLRYRPGSRGAW